MFVRVVIGFFELVGVIVVVGGLLWWWIKSKLAARRERRLKAQLDLARQAQGPTGMAGRAGK
jgi:hypothetical protein